MKPKYRVGDILYDEVHSTRGKVVRVKNDNGRPKYDVRHVDGYLTTDSREDRFRLIRHGDTPLLGDKVMIRKTGHIGTVVETTQSGSEITEVGVMFHDRTQDEYKTKEVEIVRREGAPKSTANLVGQRVKIVGAGKTRHGFRRGDICTVDDVMTIAEATRYLLIRESDGFEQVVTLGAFETYDAGRQVVITPAEEIIDAIYTEVVEEGEKENESLSFDSRTLPFKHRTSTPWKRFTATKEISVDGFVYSAFTTFDCVHMGLYVTMRIDGGRWEVNITEDAFKLIFDCVISPDKDEEAESLKEHATEYPKRKEEESTMELAKQNEEVTELQRKIAQLEAEKEEIRKQKVDDTFGKVEKNHLWSVTILVPAKVKWLGESRATEKTTEVVTEGQSMVEAAMVAEAMAQGIHADARVMTVTYQRVLGAIK